MEQPVLTHSESPGTSIYALLPQVAPDELCSSLTLAELWFFPPWAESRFQKAPDGFSESRASRW